MGRMDTLRYTYNVDGSYIYISSRWTSPPVPSWTPTDGSAPLGVYFVGSFSSLKGAAAAAGESVGLRCFLFFFSSPTRPLGLGNLFRSSRWPEEGFFFRRLAIRLTMRSLKTARRNAIKDNRIIDPALISCR